MLFAIGDDCGPASSPDRSDEKVSCFSVIFYHSQRGKIVIIPQRLCLDEIESVLDLVRIALGGVELEHGVCCSAITGPNPQAPAPRRLTHPLRHAN